MESKADTGMKNNIKMIVLFVLLTIPFFQISILMDTISVAGKMYSALQLIAGAAVVFLIYRKRAFSRISPLMLVFDALLLVMVIAGAVNGGGIKRPLQYAFGTLMYCLVVEYGILEDIRSYLQANIALFGILTVINMISILVFPHGMYVSMGYYWESWILGFKSGHIMYQMVLLFSAAMYAVLFEKKKWMIFRISVVLVFVSSMLANNRTATVVLIPMIIFGFFPRILEFTKVFNIAVYGVLGVLINLLFVVFRMQNLFSWLIVGILHRSINLTSRTVVWDKAFKAIAEHPVIGHGYQDFQYNPIIYTTHNEALEVLFKTGIIGLIIFLAAFVIVSVRLFKNRKLEAAQWISVFLGGFFLMFVVEQYAFAIFFYLLLFAWHVEELKTLAAECCEYKTDKSYAEN